MQNHPNVKSEYLLFQMKGKLSLNGIDVLQLAWKLNLVGEIPDH